MIKKSISTKTSLNWTDELTQYFPNKQCIENAIHLSSKNNESMCILHNVLYSYASFEDHLIGEWIKTQLLGFCFLEEPDKLNNHVSLIVMFSNITTTININNVYTKFINSNYNLTDIKNHTFFKELNNILFNHNVDNIGYFTWYVTKIWNTDNRYANLKIKLNVPFTPDNLEDFKDSIKLIKSNNDMIYLCDINESLFRDLFHYHYK